LLLAAGARRCRVLIDISCPWGAQQQTRRTPLLLLIGGTPRRTDQRTLDRLIDPAAHTTRERQQQRRLSLSTNGETEPWPFLGNSFLIKNLILKMDDLQPFFCYNF